MTLLAAIALALAGGLILNLMPCVFPVLSLKALSLAAPGRSDTPRLRASGLAFAAGVVVTFVALAGALLALRAAGEQVGWGFQLQSPAVVTALAMLFFVLALNLSGVFEFGALWTGSGRAAANPLADAFLSGVLAVVIASPCTAPFMGAALGYALTEPAAATLAVFVALGVGMALPFVLLSWFPGWRRMLPRPGAWMVRLKQLLAFPLYATVAWLAWVLGAQVDNDAVMRLMVTLVIVAFALWAWRAFRGGGSRAFSVAAPIALAVAVVVAWPLLRGDAVAYAAAAARPQAEDAAWQPWSPARVADLTRAGKPVFVDFTAAWCVTCQVNKRLVLNDASVRAAFARRRRCAGARRLDAARPCHHAGARCAGPQRRAGVRAVPAGPRTFAAAGGPEQRTRRRCARRDLSAEYYPFTEVDRSCPFPSCARSPSPPRSSAATALAQSPGQAAPDFTLTDTAGKSVKLSDLRGKYVVLEWTNPDCPFVRNQYDKRGMQAQQKRWSGQDVVWVTINSTNKSHSEFKAPAVMASWMKAQGGAPAVLSVDGESAVARRTASRRRPRCTSSIRPARWSTPVRSTTAARRGTIRSPPTISCRRR